jgi:ADP-ribosylglycohydrolase
MKIRNICIFLYPIKYIISESYLFDKTQMDKTKVSKQQKIFMEKTHRDEISTGKISIDKHPMHKVVCMVINGALGDQYGAPLEMMVSDMIREKHGDVLKDYVKSVKDREDYTYTDDTQMTIGVINFLIDTDAGTSASTSVSTSTSDGKDYTFERMLEYHLKYFEPSRGYSMNVYNLFTDLISKGDLSALDMKKSVSRTTNGGLMRVSPLVAPCMSLTDEDIFEMVKIVHYPTHMCPETIHTSMIYIKFLKFLYARDLSSKTTNTDLFESILKYIEKTLIPSCDEYKNVTLCEKLKYLVKNIDSDEYTIIEELIGYDGVECHEALVCAMVGLIKNLDNPSEIVGKTITYGGDCDTIAGIAGQMSGILFGRSAINEKWLEKLENKALLVQISEKLVNKFLM